MSTNSRQYPPRPLVGVAGVIFRGEDVLLIRRGREPAKGIWSVPGGLAKVGETLAQGVAREVAEETALTVEVGGLVEVVERIDRDEADRVRYHYVIHDYCCRWVDGRPTAGSDADRAEWFSPARLAASDLDPVLIRVIDRARKMAADWEKS